MMKIKKQMQKYSIFFFLALFQTLSSQTLLSKQPIEFARKSNERFIHSVVDQENLDTYIFIHDRDFFKLYQYSLAFLKKDSMELPQLDKKWSIAGSRTDSISKPQLFWVNDDFSEVIRLTYDINRKVVKNTNPISLSKQEFVCQMFTHQNRFYILTISQKEQWFRLYEFGEQEKPIITTFRLPEFKIVKNEKKVLDFNNILNHKSAVEFPYTIEFIDPDKPVNLLSASKKRKMYVNKGKMMISLDFHPEKTHWIIVDLKQKNLVHKTTDYPSFNGAIENDNHYNSFLFEDVIFTIQSSKEEIQMAIIDWESKPIKLFKANKNEEITFKNGPVYFQRKQDKEPSMFRKNKFFLRKIKNAHLGISVYKSVHELWVNTGGVNENLQMAYIAGDAFLNAIMAVGGQEYGYVPMLQDFVPTEYKMSYFDLKMDLNYNPLTGEMPFTTYANINEFLQTIPEAKDIIVFRRGIYDVLGYYMPKENLYYYRQFLP